MDGSLRPKMSRVTRTGHKQDRNPAAQQSPEMCYPFGREHREALVSETARFHIAHRRRGDCVAARSARAAAGDAGDRQLRWLFGRKVMEWFNQKTSIAGIQVSNWMIALGAIIVILLAYSFMR